LVKKDSKVFGLDIDEKMLSIASKNQKNIEYIKANVEKLPFDNSFFDLVTMFTSFHWFANRKTLKEIKRVLKPKGTVCIIQPKHTAIFINDHKEIIEKALEVTLKTKYSTKNFEDILVKNNFKIINNKVYKVVYKYTLEQFLKLLQTYSIWNEVPASKRKLVLNLFRKHYRALLKNGFIHDTVDLELISARSIK
jgi:ubiquinone/menaquinone biosynthesis C-methylase UbiE